MPLRKMREGDVFPTAKHVFRISSYLKNLRNTEEKNAEKRLNHLRTLGSRSERFIFFVLILLSLGLSICQAPFFCFSVFSIARGISFVNFLFRIIVYGCKEIIRRQEKHHFSIYKTPKLC